MHTKLRATAILLSCMLTAGLVADEKQDKHEQMVYPVVRVSYGNSGGSGTVIYSEDRDKEGTYETYILTNHHVVSSAISIVTEWSSLYGREIKRERRKTVKVEVFRYEELSIVVGRESFDADIMAHSKNHDLALLKLRTKREIDVVADMKELKKAGKVYLFDPVVVVGCSLLHPPLITSGEITSLNDEIDGKSYWMSNAQIIYGNSGGAVFTKDGDKWVFVGVPSRISIANWTTPVTHMGYFIPVTRIYKWCEKEQLSFIYDKHITPKACFDKRKELAKKSAPLQPILPEKSMRQQQGPRGPGFRP